MSDWKITRVSQMAKILSGGTPKTEVEEYWNGNIPWLSVKDFAGDTRKVYASEKHISELGLNNSATQLLHPGDIIISARGTVGEVAQIGKTAAFNQSCYGLRATDGYSSDYLYYMLKYQVRYLKSVANGAVFDTIVVKTFDRMKASVPDLPTQARIADILSAYDDLIENNNRRIALLEKAAQELYKEWFVRFRFPSHENAKFENGLPMGWDVAKLGSILILEDTKRVPLSEQQRSGMQPIYPYYGACSIAGYVDKYIFDGVYLLLSEDGANVVDENGYPTLQYVWGKFWVNNHAHIISKNGVYSVEFLHLLLKNTNMQSIVTGAAQPKISQKRLLNKKVIVPDSKIIKLFSERIDPIYKMIRYISESNRNIEKQRELLLPRLMSGKLEV